MCATTSGTSGTSIYPSFSPIPHPSAQNRPILRKTSTCQSITSIGLGIVRVVGILTSPTKLYSFFKRSSPSTAAEAFNSIPRDQPTITTSEPGTSGTPLHLPTMPEMVLTKMNQNRRQQRRKAISSIIKTTIFSSCGAFGIAKFTGGLVFGPVVSEMATPATKYTLIVTTLCHYKQIYDLTFGAHKPTPKEIEIEKKFMLYLYHQPTVSLINAYVYASINPTISYTEKMFEDAHQNFSAAPFETIDCHLNKEALTMQRNENDSNDFSRYYTRFCNYRPLRA